MPPQTPKGKQQLLQTDRIMFNRMVDGYSMMVVLFMVLQVHSSGNVSFLRQVMFMYMSTKTWFLAGHMKHLVMIVGFSIVSLLV